MAFRRIRHPFFYRNRDRTKGKPRDIYPRMSKFFPNLTELDLAERLSTGSSKWTNRIQWVRQRLIAKGEMESPEHGIWAITEKGRNRLATASTLTTRRSAKLAKAEKTAVASIPNLEELAEDYLTAFKEKVVQKLADLTAGQFERFSAALLAAYGFNEVKITGRSSDGGIDGHGKLKVGLALINVAFQCKRWQRQVGRPEIDKFRGAIQGKFEQGVFFTTSDFSGPARDASITKGAAPIVLLNGDAIVQLMLDRGLGMKRRPVEVYEDQIDTLFEEGKHL